VGIDVDRRLIDWCKKNIQAKDSRFQFLHVPARNDLYNPRGRVEMTQLSIPVGTADVSFAFATSVFTHLRAAHADHYLRELGRTLRTGGRLLVTAFLVDPVVSTPPDKFSPGMEFKAIDAETWTTDLALPERAIGFRLGTLERWASAGGLTLVKVLRGSWIDAEDGYSYQDILIFVKR
jgi:SAM-dependent methyltransferase